MQNDNSTGGDGVSMGPTGEEPLQTALPIQGDKSETQAELETKIEQELGLPHVPSKVTTDEDISATDTESTDASDDAGTDATESSNTEETESDKSEEVEKPLEPSIPTDEELFIEVEDADGVTHKISQIEDLPEDFTPKNNRQIIQIVSQLGKLDAQMEQREVERQATAEQAEQQAAQQAQFTAWDNEITELAKEKRIDPADTERVGKVFEHIAKINEARAKVGNPNLITSFEDGLDKFVAAEAKTKAEDAKKAENDRAKAKASLIGGNNSTGGNAPQPYYSGRYRSMDDIPV